MAKQKLLPSPLFHYTCAHCRPKIVEDGVIRPGVDGLVWLTDLPIANRDALGLTRNYITCDRTEFRFDVDATDGIRWWPDFRRGHAERQWREWARWLESAPDVRPAHWYVSPLPVKGVPSCIERGSIGR
jgi:hypothetical protein